MLNYLHKSREWPKSITAFRYVVNTILRVPARAICSDQTRLSAHGHCVILQHRLTVLFFN